MADAPRWSDDPWSALTTGEGEVWRRGWEAARRQAKEALETGAEVALTKADTRQAEGRTACAAFWTVWAAAYEQASSAIAAMEPPA